MGARGGAEAGAVVTEDAIPERLAQIEGSRLRDHLFHLSADPLPFRKLNYTIPGHDRCTLYEADDYIVGQLQNCGYEVKQEGVVVQAFRTDRSRPMPHQFSYPEREDPSYTAYNLYARMTGTRLPAEYLVVIAHKDSQSWTDSPGAYDNASGTAAVLEIARALSSYESKRSIWFVFCNEEHTPWTSAVVAQGMADACLTVRGVINVDSIGGRAQAEVDAGRLTHCTRFTTPEGEALAQRTAQLNERYQLGLITGRFQSEQPNDDDGSFIKAGIPAAVLHIGSYPYGNPDYHASTDTPDKVDIDLITRSARLSLALLLDLDRESRIEGSIWNPTSG